VKPRTYKTPEAFKVAIDLRLRQLAGSGAAITRRRQLLVFDRFLARICRTFGDSAVLKGGLVLEVRLDRARTTRDIDLRVSGSPAALLERLQEAGRLDLGDFMAFEVRSDARHPEIAGPGVQYEGQRFRAECRMAGRLYGQAFGVDVAFGDPIHGAPERVSGDDFLAFAGVPAPELLLYPVETHIAEKLHAYTLPRPTASTRVKDLPDLALLGQVGSRDARRLREAIDLTFNYRRTHPVPGRLPAPPDAWAPPYAAMAAEDDLPWRTLAEVTTAARAFLDPILTGEDRASWDPGAWTWK
jgi:hypothetical protein